MGDYQFCRIPFGVTKGVAVFQRAMDKMVDEGRTQWHLSISGQHRSSRAKPTGTWWKCEQVPWSNSTEKSYPQRNQVVESEAFINILGYCVGDAVIKPDQERLRPLTDYPPPTNVGSLRRVVGMFVYYAKGIPNFSDKIQPFVNATSFPLDESTLSAFDLLKKELERATIPPIQWWKPTVCGWMWCIRGLCLCNTKPTWTTCCIHVKDTPR